MSHENKDSNTLTNALAREDIQTRALRELRVGVGDHANSIWSIVADDVTARLVKTEASLTDQSVADMLGRVLVDRLTAKQPDAPTLTVNVTSDAAKATVERACILVQTFAGANANTLLSIVLRDIVTENERSDKDIRNAIGAAIITRLTAK